MYLKSTKDKAKIVNSAFTCDIIVWFLWETEEEFENIIEIIKKLSFMKYIWTKVWIYEKLYRNKKIA